MFKEADDTFVRTEAHLLNQDKTNRRKRDWLKHADVQATALRLHHKEIFRILISQSMPFYGNSTSSY